MGINGWTLYLKYLTYIYVLKNVKVILRKSGQSNEKAARDDKFKKKLTT